MTASPRSRSRSRAQVAKDLKEVEWTKRGQKNSRAVIDAVNRATGFKLPVKDKYMEMLEQYKQQVLPMKYPTCPLGWERHTSNPKESEEMGVAWVDADGYFCAPPGSSPETLYKEDDHMYDSATALSKRITDLTTEIKHTLNPTEYAKEIAEMKKKGSMQKEAMARSMIARTKAQEKSNEQMRKKNIDKLKSIFKSHGFVDQLEAASEAEKLYDTAVRCVNENAEKSGCTAVVDRSNPEKPITYYVPSSLHVTDKNMATPLQIKALEWWRGFRRHASSTKQIEDRKNLSLYV